MVLGDKINGLNGKDLQIKFTFQYCLLQIAWCGSVRRGHNGARLTPDSTTNKCFFGATFEIAIIVWISASAPGTYLAFKSTFIFKNVL